MTTGLNIARGVPFLVRKSLHFLRLTVLFFAVLVLFSSYSFSTIAWNNQIVDPSITSQFASLAMDSGGTPYIAYFDATNGCVKYASLEGGSWNIQVVSYVTNNWGVALALDSAGRPHIAYEDGYSLMYASWESTGWSIQTVDTDAGPTGIGGDNSIVLDSSGKPHISYCDYDNFILKYASWEGTTWDIQTVDGNYGTGYYTSIKLDSAGKPHISYNDYVLGNLNYATWEGTVWDIQVADSFMGSVGMYSALALDSAGHPYISYFDSYYTQLRFASFEGTTWDIQQLSGPIGYAGTSIALDGMGIPHIAWFDSTTSLWYASENGASWDYQSVDTSGNGFNASLVIDSAGFTHIAHANAFGLRYSSSFDRPVVNMLSPNGGESYYAGQDVTITWSATDEYYGIAVNSITIEYSTDNGGSWNNIVPNSANTGIYTWEAPPVLGTLNLIRVSAANATTEPVWDSDTSNSTFTIRNSVIVTVETPNGGEFYSVGDIVPITWEALDPYFGIATNSITIEYSANAGVTWHTIVSDYSNTGSYLSWVPPGVGGHYAIRIKASNNSTPMLTNSDNSNGQFAVGIGTVYVSTTGSDDAGDGSIGNPFRTIKFGLSICSADGTVFVSGGTYNEHEIAWPDRDNITLEALSAIPVTVDAQNYPGLLHASADLWIKNITFMNGYQPYFFGTAGLTFGYGTVHLENVNIFNCVTDYMAGAAIYASSCTLEAINCRFANNSANEGPAIYLHYNSKVRFINCRIDHNNSYDSGAVFLDQTNYFEGVNCRFDNNISGYGAAIAEYAVYLDDFPQCKLYNCIFENNSGGSGVLTGSAYLSTYECWEVVNCDFYNNSSVYAGAGGVVGGTSQFKSVNSIFWGNTATYPVFQLGITSFSVDYADVQPDGLDSYTFGPGLITSEPNFKNAAAHNFHLLKYSACIDAGTLESEVPVLDADGNPRPYSTTLGDIGAYEYQGFPAGQIPVVYVTTTGNDLTGTGTIEQPFRTIQKGLDMVIDTGTGEVILGPGTYNYDAHDAENMISWPDKAATLIASVDAYGRPVPVTIDAGGSKRAILVLDTVDITISDITIKNGNANGGGAIALFGDANLVLSNVIISGCNGRTSPGGAVNAPLTATINASNCLFYNNTTNSDGGFSWGGSWEVINSVFYNNTAPTGSGAVWMDSFWRDTNSIYYNNTAYNGKIFYWSSDPNYPNILRYCDVYPPEPDGPFGSTNKAVNPGIASTTVGAAGFLHLGPGSKCIDAGTNSGAPAFDLAGIPRPHNWKSDMGAYEFRGPSISVESPNGGEVYIPGATIEVTWICTDEYGIRTSPLPIIIKFSDDGGLTWTTVASGIANTGIYTMEAPATASHNCFISVEAVNASTEPFPNLDSSDAPFSILATVVYVSPSGSDEGGDGTSGNPYRTIQKGLNSVAPGGFVYMKSGTYQEIGDYNINWPTIEGISLKKDPAATSPATMEALGHKGFDFMASLSLTIEGITIQDCSNPSSNGSVIMGHNNSLSLWMKNVTVQNCSAEYNSGGAIDVSNNSNIFLEKCRFFKNSANNGGVINTGTNAELFAVNSIFAENHALNIGGVANGVNSSTWRMMNCDFTNNSGGTGGGAVAANVGTWESVNSIYWDNPISIYMFSAIGTELVIKYSDIQADGWTTDLALLVATNSISVEPLFISTAESTYDLHLLPTSECINSGTSEGAPSDDLDGKTRPIGAGFDMGAYEYGTAEAARPIHNLTSGVSYDSLSDAITDASTGDVIAIDPGVIATSEIVINKDLTIVGSGAAVTFISGEGNGPVLIVDNATLTLEALTIMDGSAESGGAISAEGATLDIAGVNFESNKADTDGGAVYASNSIVLLVNDLFNRNTAGVDGGGVAGVNSTQIGVINCTFYLNTAVSGTGGGIYVDGTSSVNVLNSVFWANSPDQIGGGGTKTVNYTDIQGSWSGTGNLNADPKFVSSTIPYDFNTQPGSPVIDSGTTGTGVPTIDIDAKSRPYGYGYDMGAYEYHGPYIKVIQPNGGEHIAAESVYLITYSITPDASEIRIRLSTTYGISWIVLITDESTGPFSGIGTYEWTVNDMPSPNCIISIEALIGATWFYDKSDATFEITAAVPTSLIVTVEAPNGGEKVTAEAVYDIMWSVTLEADEIYVRLSTNEGSTWDTLVTYEPWAHTGLCTYEWTPSLALVSSECLISVEARKGSTWAFDTSDATFEIILGTNVGSREFTLAFYSGYEINYISLPFAATGITNLDELVQSIGTAWLNSGQLDLTGLDGLQLETFDNLTKASKGYVYYGYDGSAWVEAQPPGGDTSIGSGDAIMVHVQPHLYGDLVTRNLSFTWEVSGIIPVTGEVYPQAFFSGYEINYSSLPYCVSGASNLDELAQSIGAAWLNSGQLDLTGLDGLQLETFDNLTKVSKGYVYYGYDGSAWVEAQPPGGDTSVSSGDAVMVHVQPHLYGDLVTRNLSFTWP